MDRSRGAGQQAVAEDGTGQVRSSIRECDNTGAKTTDFTRCHSVADVAVGETGLKERGRTGNRAGVFEETG